jgi:hypothetical protein
VWIHGDLDARNLLVEDGRLSGVVDFGGLGVGDPACDVMVACVEGPADGRPGDLPGRPVRGRRDLDAEPWLGAVPGADGPAEPRRETLWRVDPSVVKDRAVATVSVRVAAERLAVGRSGVWVIGAPAERGQRPDRRVVRVDVHTNRVAQIFSVNGTPQDVAAQANGVWVATAAPNRLVRLEPS